MGNVPRFFGDQIAIANVAELSVGANAGVLPSTGLANAHVAANAAIAGSKLATEVRTNTKESLVFNFDIGAGTTKDVVLMRSSLPITITAARLVYTEATAAAGVAAATFKIGTAVAGEQIVAAANVEQPKAIGTATALTIVNGAVAADTPVCIRLTGVVATPLAGEGFIEIEYTVDD